MHAASHAHQHTQPPTRSCHRACATHHRLVDRRAPSQQRTNTLHVPVLAGDVQRGGTICLPRHTALTPNPSRPHAWPHHCIDTSAAAHDSCMHARKLPQDPRTQPPEMSCHRACATHIRLVDRRAPSQQRPNTLHVPGAASAVQRRGTIRLSRHTALKQKHYAPMPGLTTALTRLLQHIVKVAMLPMT